jgi:hypothetical protein
MSEACCRQESSLAAILLCGSGLRFDLVLVMPIVAGHRLRNLLRGQLGVIAGAQHVTG